MPPSETRLYLAINHCPIHRLKSISLDRGHGSIRLTSGECCGHWDTVQQFLVDPERLLLEIKSEVEAIDNAAE